MSVFHAAMPFFDATERTDRLSRHLTQHPGSPIVACYCAAWCNTCAGYRKDFERLAQDWPDHAFVWIDIEERPELLGDEDIENFPTLLLQNADKTLFFGILQPHIQHLQGLLQRGEALAPVLSAPRLRDWLSEA
ncbi:thioredoxin family protein [Paracandidimonas soli]|uniref:thioredoxin family protein n=1 Tax=Paracandidimonas soli TaxID=1917182 RepID=UPI003342279C